MGDGGGSAMGRTFLSMYEEKIFLQSASCT